VNAAVLLGLGRFPGELPSLLINLVDHTLILALSRTLVRLRNELAAIVSQQMCDRDSDRLHHLSTEETIRCLPAEEYGVAVSDTNTLLAALSLRNLANLVGPPMGARMLATPERPPFPPSPQYGAG